ncbi:MAG: DUF2279 domain-containing protein [Acidobacteriota bacterium]
MSRIPPGHSVGPSARRLAIALLLLPAALPAADSFELFPPSVPAAHYFTQAAGRFPPLELELPGSWDERPERVRLILAASDLQGLASRPTALGAAAPKTPNRTLTVLLTAGVLAGSAVSSLGVGHEREAFHFGNEEWFGSDTYAGGADKASHFVFYNGLSRELGVTLANMGHDRKKATTLAFATATAAGLLVEVGDAFTVFGFAWEDLVMDTLGAGSAAVITRYGLDDTVGFRFGKVTAEQPPVCCRTPGVGKDYSEEIYTADLKLAGFARRLSLRPGPARFLLLSMTYGTKGYRYSLPEFRQRNIGIELGLNFPEILSAVGVPERTWWGRALYFFFNFFRIPFTQVGFHYDLNHGKWHGPDAGNVYDPGP